MTARGGGVARKITLERGEHGFYLCRCLEVSVCPGGLCFQLSKLLIWGLAMFCQLSEIDYFVSRF